MKKSPYPRKIKALHEAKSAWIFTNTASIDVFIQGENGLAFGARITKKQLEEILREKAKKRSKHENNLLHH